MGCFGKVWEGLVGFGRFWNIIGCFVEVINKCLYLFRGDECRDNEADG